MITYVVKYKRQSDWFWRTIHNVTGDAIQDGGAGMRSFVCADEARHEVPMAGTVFWFSKERMDVIKENARIEQERAQREPARGATNGE